MNTKEYCYEVNAKKGETYHRLGQMKTMLQKITKKL